MPMGLGTRAQELALYVVFESPLEMVSDYPEHYAGQKEFDFIKRVPCHLGRGARRLAAGRWSGFRWRGGAGTDWYVGSLTNWDERDVKVPLGFLGEGKYVAEIYADAPDAARKPRIPPLSKMPVDRTDGAECAHGFRRRERDLDPSGGETVRNRDLCSLYAGGSMLNPDRILASSEIMMGVNRKQHFSVPARNALGRSASFCFRRAGPRRRRRRTLRRRPIRFLAV